MGEPLESRIQTAPPVQLASSCLCSTEPLAELSSSTCSFCTRATKGEVGQASTLALTDGCRARDQAGARLTKSQAVNKLLETAKTILALAALPKQILTTFSLSP